METAFVFKDFVTAILTLTVIVISFVGLKYQIRKDNEKQINEKADKSDVEKKIMELKSEVDKKIEISEIEKLEIKLEHAHNTSKQNFKYLDMMRRKDREILVGEIKQFSNAMNNIAAKLDEFPEKMEKLLNMHEATKHKSA